jgi:quercetin dioxygenase-like cupin family protein
VAKPVHVPAGLDREGKKHAIGLSSTTYKVLTQDTGGALFVLEQSNQKKGGPPRHLHHDVDELFYSLEGEYIVEIGSARFHLKPGDCLLGPREIPHAWAFAGAYPEGCSFHSRQRERWKLSSTNGKIAASSPAATRTMLRSCAPSAWS